MGNGQIRYLSADDIRRALPMSEAIQAVRGAFVELSMGRAQVPQRLSLDIPEHAGAALIMPAYSPVSGKIGIKLLSLYESNPAQSLPFIQAMVVLMDATNGRPIALLEGTSLTALRTGAASGVATELLARADARVAAIFGAGVQGRTQLAAVAAVRPLERAMVYDLEPDRARAFADEMSKLLALPVAAPEGTVGLIEADVICTATSASEPVFDHTGLRPGTHINAIGSYQPDRREVPPDTVAAALVYIDHFESCMTEAGDILIPIREGIITEEHIRGEIGQLAAGTLPGRETDKDYTLFKSVGNAIQDLATAGAVYERACEQNLGTVIDL